MNVEFFRRETTKKNIGLTKLPGEDSESVTIAKGLEPNDFMGMIINVGGTLVTTVATVEIAEDTETRAPFYTIHGTGFTYIYRPSTGDLIDTEF